MNGEEDRHNAQEHIDRLNRKDDSHEALGLHPDASEEEIEDRYKYLRKLVHPDKNEGRKDATEAFQKLQIFYQKLLNPYVDINENIFPSDSFFDDDLEEKEFEKYQQWKKEFEKEYTEDIFRRRNGDFERQNLKFIIITLSILAGFLAIGFHTIHNHKLSNHYHSYRSTNLSPPTHLSSQTVFIRECYQVKNKSCVILFLPESGICSEKMNELNRKHFETSVQKIKTYELGRMWSHYGDQHELEYSINVSNDTVPPFLLFADFRKEKFGVKKLQEYDDKTRIREWISGFSKRELENGFNMNTSKWSKWSSKLARTLPNIKSLSAKSQWKYQFKRVIFRVLPELCYFFS